MVFDYYILTHEKRKMPGLKVKPRHFYEDRDVISRVMCADRVGVSVIYLCGRLPGAL